jgi:hypothetical protein
MPIKKKQEIDEKVTVGGGTTGASMTADTVGGKATLPRSNSNSEPMKKAQNPANIPIEITDPANNTKAEGDAAKNQASVKMREEIAQLFDGQDVTEDFINKATTLFEGAVALKVADLEKEIQAAHEATLDEEVLKIREELSEKVETYLDRTSTKWLEENAVAIESSLKAELTEDFINGMKNLFAEHYMEIPEDKIDVLESLALRVEELESQVNEATVATIEKDKIIESFKKSEVFDSIANGLSLAQKDKLKTMSEGIVAEPEVYKTKLETLKESLIGGQYKKVESNILTESLEGSDESSKKAIEPEMRRYVDAISRSIGKKQ